MTREDALAQIEMAMVAIRKSQTRRSLARAVESAVGATFNLSNTLVVDAVAQDAGAVSGAPNVGEIAVRLGVDPSRASRMTGEAIAAGLVRRVAMQSDGRSSGLVLTKEGQRQLDLARGVRLAHFGRLTQDWSAKDCVDFARLLSKFIEAMNREKGE